jgi:hypothetical protein
MKRNDAERLLISIGIAAGLFGAAVLTLSFIDIPAGEMPPYQGPVFITIDEEPSVFQEPPEEAPEEPAPSPAAAAEKPAERPEPPREPEEPPPAETDETGRSESRQASSAGVEAAAETAAEGAAPEEAEEPAAAGVDTGTAETEPLPEGDSEADVSPRQGPETVEETAPAAPDAPGPEERSILGGELMNELDALIPRAEGEASETAEEAGSEGTAFVGDEITQLGTPGSPIDFETLTANRKPISTPEPKIDSELATGLPPVFQVVIAFTLQHSGTITYLNFIKDSGNNDIDSIIRNTILKWTFQPVSEDAGPIQVRVRYNIRVR